MKNLITTMAAAVLLIAGPAAAADLRVAVAPPAVYSWTGFYVGAHVGGGFQSTSFQDPSATTNITLCCDLIGTLAPGAAASTANGSGFLGGGQVGFAYQVGRLVVGNEFDFSGTKIRNNAIGIIPGAAAAANNVTESFSARTDWTAAATVKVGFAKDLWLFYTKGGVAWAHENYGLGVTGINNNFGPGAGLPFSFNSSTGNIRVGYTVGAGLAYAFAENWSVKVEYDYMNFGAKGIDFTGFINNASGINSNSTFNTTNSQSLSQVKLGVDYKFAPNFFF